jgi:hypothetical protein
MRRIGLGFFLGISLTSIATLTAAQAPVQKLKFEVASVKAAKSSDTGFMDTTPGRFVATAAPLRLLLKEAYDLMDAQIAGGPRLDQWRSLEC